MLHRHPLPNLEARDTCVALTVCGEEDVACEIQLTTRTVIIITQLLGETL